MADLGTLTPGAWISLGSTLQIQGTDPVLESIAGADDADYVFTDTNNSQTEVGQFALANMPGDFATMDTLFVQLRYHRNSDDISLIWDSLQARVFQSDGTTVLTDVVTVASNITTSNPTNSAVVQFTGVNTTADATTWDGAIFKVFITRTRIKGGANIQDRVTAGELTGTYTASGPQTVTGTGASTLAGATSAGTGTQTISGTGASTLADVTSAGSGTTVETFTGTGASTLAGATSAGSGTQTITGTGASTLDGVTSAGSGTVVGDEVAFDAVSSAQVSDAASLTFAHTCSGTDRVLYVGFSLGARVSTNNVDAADIVPTVTYGGVSMAHIGDSDSVNGFATGAVHLFRLVNPATGANNVVITMDTGTSDIQAGAISFTNVDQSDPDDAVQLAEGSGTATSVVVASATGDMVVDVVGTGGGVTSSDQTSRWIENNNASNAAGNAGGSTAAGATSVTMGYTVSDDVWAILAANVNVASGVQTVTGTGASTLAGATSAGAGTQTISGTGAPTLDGATSAGSGTVANPVTGTGASTLDDVTSAGSGTQTISGTGASTLAGATSEGSGTTVETFTGTGASTLAGATSAGTGTQTISGTGAPTLDGATSAGSGTQTISGTGAPTLAGATSEGTGTTVETFTGTGASTLADVTSSGAGTQTISGTGAPTLAGATSTGSGAQTVTGSGSPTLAGATSSGSGTTSAERTGTGASTLEGATSAGSGSQTLSGSGAITLTGVTSAGSGTVANPASGTGASTLDDVTCAGVGSVANPVTGTGASTLVGVTSTGVGGLGRWHFVPPTRAGKRVVYDPEWAPFHPRALGFFQRIPGAPAGINVWRDADGVWHEGNLTNGDAETAQAVYLGGRTHVVGSDEKNALEAAGYEVTPV